MKGTVILTKNPATLALLRKAVTTALDGGLVEIFASDWELVDRVHAEERVPPAMVFVDLTTSSDAERLVGWLRLSPLTRKLNIVAVGKEGETIARFRKMWGAHAVLTTPLNMEAVCGVLKKADRNLKREGLAVSIEDNKRLRAQQERLMQRVDALVAEVKDKKIPFNRKRKGDAPAAEQ